MDIDISFMYQMYILLITLVNQGRVFDVLKASAGVLGIILMMVIFSKFNSEYLLRIFQVYFYIIVLVTLITTFLYPNGLYTLNNYEPGSSAQVNSIRYFVGHKNQVVPFLLTGYIASVLLWVKRRKWLDGVVAISYIGILITITLIIDSMTSFAACVMLAGCSSDIFLQKCTANNSGNMDNMRHYLSTCCSRYFVYKISSQPSLLCLGEMSHFLIELLFGIRR